MTAHPSSARALVLIGAGGHAREIIAQVEAINAHAESTGVQAAATDARTDAPDHFARVRDAHAPPARSGPLDTDTPPIRWHLLGLLVDDAWRGTEPVDGTPQLGPPEWLRARADVWACVAVGDPALRLRLAGRAAAAGAAGFATLVHPRAWIAPRVTLGPGCQIMAGALVNAHASLGAHVILNLGSSVSHDCVLGDGVTLGPGARLAGGVTIGAATAVGMGALVLPGVSVGRDATIGAGAVVTRPVPDGVTVVGNPARVLQRGH